MGYYSRMEFNGKVRKDKVEELKKQIEYLKSLPDDKKPDFYWYFMIEMKVEEDNEGNTWVTWYDYFQKWYNDLEFVLWISEFVEPQDIMFYGEDGEAWGYRIKEDGKVVELEMVIKEGRVLNDKTTND